MTECIKQIREFIDDNGFTYSVGDIIRSYRKYYNKPGYYCSFTTELVIEWNYDAIKFLDKYLRKRNR